MVFEQRTMKVNKNVVVCSDFSVRKRYFSASSNFEEFLERVQCTIILY
jgi:hypothetical protein